MKRSYKVLLLVSILTLGFGILFTLIQKLTPLYTTNDTLGERTDSHSQNSYQVLTGEESEKVRDRWDARFKSDTYVFGTLPAKVLSENIDRIPVGRVLDIAMGEGRNAVFLAKKGFQVDGVDISAVALRKAHRLARKAKVTLQTVNADLREYQIPAKTYDAIVNIDYLQRDLVPQIKQGLKPGGYVIFENLTVEQLNNPTGKGLRRDYLLEKGELKQLFNGFEIVLYEEFNDGKTATARLIARKPL